MRKGDEILVFITSTTGLFLFIGILIPIFKTFGYDLNNIGGAEAFLLMVIFYLLGYILVVRNLHKSYLFSYVYVTFFSLLFGVLVFESAHDDIANEILDSSLFGFLPLLFYHRLRKKYFNLIDYDEREYQKKSSED